MTAMRYSVKKSRKKSTKVKKKGNRTPCPLSTVCFLPPSLMTFCSHTGSFLISRLDSHITIYNDDKYWKNAAASAGFNAFVSIPNKIMSVLFRTLAINSSPPPLFIRFFTFLSSPVSVLWLIHFFWPLNASTELQTLRQANQFMAVIEVIKRDPTWIGPGWQS